MRDKLGRFIKGSSEGFQKGHPYYLTKESIEKIIKSLKEQHKSGKRKYIYKKISQALKGNKNCLGNKHTEEAKRKIGEKNKGRIQSKELRGRRSKIHKGKHYSPRTEFKKGEKHPDWQGGKSFEPYGLEFNNDLKEVIRNRDKRKCQLCEKTELENKRKMYVHHINYCKQNNDPKNLITLCKICHGKTNRNRKYWTNYFTAK